MANETISTNQTGNNAATPRGNTTSGSVGGGDGLQLPLPLPFPPLSLFNDKERTISHALTQDSNLTPKKATKRLFPKPNFLSRFYRRWTIKWDLTHGRVWTADELEQAYQRGNFPRRPSDLFLKIYADVLICLTRNPLAGNVSPSLLGSSGTVPLSIVSTIPDIMRHYRDCIVLAEKEVFLVTNYWQPSDSVRTIAAALRELDERVAKRGQHDKVVVKVMWDRGAIQQLWRNHVDVSPSTWVPLGLPPPEELPNISLQVINFHRPLLGTFHQKALVVDRKVALLNSNNIQDRPNIEMMVHLEGPVVDSIYDLLLISWHERFSPTLPCLAEPSPYSEQAEKPFEYTFSDSNPFLEHIDIAKAAKAARLLLSQQHIISEEQKNAVGADPDSMSPAWWQQLLEPEKPDPSQHQAAHRPKEGAFATLVQQIMDRAREEKIKAFGDGSGPGLLRRSSEVPRRSSTFTGSRAVASPAPTEGTAVEATNGASGSSKGPVLLNPPAEAGTATPVQATVGSMRLQALSNSLNAGALSKIQAAIEDETLIDDFKPHMLHAKHEPCPIALVNRPPHGAPGHNDFRVPQAAAWLGALQYAEKNVFIQTPTLNAAPIVRGVIEACSRGGKNKQGIEVTMILGLGFNDKGESVPFQGGTNEEVVFKLYKQLRRLKKEHNLHVYWYTGKDQLKPLNAVHKSRNCHVKFMSVDGQCAIVGNGNLYVHIRRTIVLEQDTQSFMHSQEANILIDDPQIVSDWMEQLLANQSTYKYGRVDTDGIWRDPTTGEELEKPKNVSCFSAVWAMIK